MTRAVSSLRPWCAVVVAAAVFAFSAPRATARTVGQLLQFQVSAFGQLVQIVLGDWAIAEADGGVTLLASGSPGGPLLARVSFLPPFEKDLEAGILPRFQFNGVPPGTYYVVLVAGVVGAPTVAPGAWKPIVVAGGCTAAPGLGVVSREAAGQSPGMLRLLMSSADGCATTFDLDAGLTPGGTEIGRLSNIAGTLAVPTPPPGTYYVRARGRNALGVGAFSDVLPISVPECNPALGQQPPYGSSNFQATVVGNNVTISWTTVPGGPPQTFQELLFLHLRVGAQPVPTLLLPATTASLSAAVPSGTYQLALLSGNGCGKSDGPAIQFTVP